MIIAGIIGSFVRMWKRLRHRPHAVVYRDFTPFASVMPNDDGDYAPGLRQAFDALYRLDETSSTHRDRMTLG